MHQTSCILTGERRTNHDADAVKDDDSVLLRLKALRGEKLVSLLELGARVHAGARRRETRSSRRGLHPRRRACEARARGRRPGGGPQEAEAAPCRERRGTQHLREAAQRDGGSVRVWRRTALATEGRKRWPVGRLRQVARNVARSSGRELHSGAPYWCVMCCTPAQTSDGQGRRMWISQCQALKVSRENARDHHWRDVWPGQTGQVELHRADLRD